MRGFGIGVAMIVAAMAAGGLAAKTTRAERGEQELRTAVKGLVPGKPERCITYSSISSTRVIPGVGLLYDLGGGRKYLNRPQGGTNFLDWDAIPVTTIFGGQLCRLDTVRLLNRATQMQSGFVMLSDFIPYRKPGKS
jgi:hypothetical protein